MEMKHLLKEITFYCFLAFETGFLSSYADLEFLILLFPRYRDFKCMLPTMPCSVFLRLMSFVFFCILK